MKKFDTFQAFARGAKSLVAILLVMLMAVSSLFAQTQQYSLVTEDQADWSGTYLITATTTQGAVNALTGINTSGSKPYGSYTTITSYVTGSVIESNATTDAGAIVVAATGTGTYTMSLNNEYLGWISDNSLTSSEIASSNNYEWNISFANGTVIITNANTAGRKLQYNMSSPRFACYTSNQTSISLYKLETSSTPEPPTPIVVSTPTFAPEAGTYDAAQNVMIACATDGAAIYYTLDGTTPTANSTLYENAIEITETATINAIAFVGETASDVATATYTINVTPIEPDEPDEPSILDYDSIATLPYVYNFDDGIDPYFMAENGEAVNQWYVGQAQTFDNKKLYISSNFGVTNKYDVTKASTVVAYRDVMVPATGAVLSFDYRVNGQAGYDYLQVSLEHGNEAVPVAQLSGKNEWTSFSYDISGELAGEVRVQFTWVNNASAGNQFPAAIDNISIIETPCSQPTALAAAVDSTTAVITWQAVEGQTAWNFQYKLADYSEWYTVPATATTLTLTDLQGNSNYDMRVQAVCGENVSAWTTGTFAVACQTEEVTVTPTDVVIGTGTSTTSYIFPGFYGWQYSASLYDMENAGPINSIAFYLNAASTTSGSSMTVWVKAVPSDYALASSNTFGTMVDGAQQIYDGAPDFSTAGWITFPVNNFTLAEGQDLLVLVRGVGCSTSGGCSKQARYTSTSNKLWYKLQDSSDPGQSVTGTMSSYRPNITINMDVTVVTCDDQIACVAPTGLQVSDVTANSAVLTWTAGDENQTSFIVEYLPAGATEWTSVEVNDTTYTLTELAQLTYHSVKVKSNCGTNNWSDVISAIFRTEGICAPVTNLETSNVSNTTTLTWLPGGEESAWLVQFKPASENEDAWTSVNVNLIPMTTFGGLVGNTDYDVRVKALCDPENEENQSEWVNASFHSGCAAFDVPFTESFAASTMPTCWENTDFHFSTSSDGYAYSNTNGAELISPAINIPAENPTYLSFEVRGSGEYTVLASYRGTRADRFEVIYTGIAPNQNTNVVVALADQYKGRAVNFKVVNNSTSYQYFHHLTVNQCPFEAASLTTSNVTGTTVDLAWEADEAAANFQVQYGEQGFTVGEGTTVDVTDTTAVTISELSYETAYDFYVRVVCEGDNGAWAGPVSATTAPACSDPVNLTFDFTAAQLHWNAGEWGTPAQYNVRYKAENDAEYNYTSVIPVDMPGYTPFATISGLASNTTYEMGVQSVCGENMESNWVILMVTTPCMPLTEIPYTQDFEGDVFPPECWSQEYVSGTQDWDVDVDATYGSGSNDATFAVSEHDLVTKLVTPAFDLSSSSNLILTFKHSQAEWVGDQDELRVYYRTSMSSNWVLLQAYTNSITSMTLEEIAIPAAAMSSSCQFAFEATGNYGHGVFLDDVTIKPAPTCGIPTISVSGVTATITPSEVGTPASYELMIGEQTATVTETSVDLSTVFTLEGSTTYQVSVRANCGGEDYSDWSDAVSFTTPCLAISSLPWNENFEGFDASTVASCWDNSASTSSTLSNNPERIWGVYSYSGNKMMRMYNYYVQSGTALINSPVITLPNTGVYVLKFDYSHRASCGAFKVKVMEVGQTEAVELGSYTSTGSNDYTNPGTFTEADPISLAAYAGKSIILQFFSNANYGSGAIFVDNVAIEEAPSCMKPSAITVGTVTETTAQVSWTAGGSETEWEVSYTIGDQTTTLTTTENPYTITGLSASTHYVLPFSVKAICSATDESEVTSTELSINTVCGLAAVPFAENFDAYTSTTSQSTMVMPLCWNRKYTGTSTSYGAGIYNSSSYAVSGTNSLRLYSYCTTSTSTSYGEVYAVLPQMDAAINTLMISFDAKAYNSTSAYYGSRLDVGVVTDAANPETSFTLIQTISAPVAGERFTISLSDYSGNGYIAFRETKEKPEGYTNSYWYNYTYVDNILVEAIPTCFVPSSLTVSEVTDHTAAVNWADNYDQTAYAVEYMSEGDPTWTSVSVDTTYTLLNNLQASTNYAVRVKAVCGTGDESEYTEVATFTTVCEHGVQVEFTGTSTSSYVPTNGNYNYSFSQQLYKSSEINAATTISGFEIEVSATGSRARNIDVYMMHTSANEITSWLPMDNAQLVYSGVVAFTQGWQQITFDTPFDYNGTDNLVLIVDDNTGEWNNYPTFYTNNGGTNCARYHYNDGTNYNPMNPSAVNAGTSYAYRNNIRFASCPEATDLAITSINDFSAACDVEGAVTIGVKNNGYDGTVSTFEAYYQVNEETPVHETVTLETPIAFNETAEYTFGQLPTFAAGTNFIVAWVELEGDLVDANNTVASAPITVLEPSAVPYVENFTGLVINEGWNPIDANNDGITMNLNNDINYTFNDEAAADDWMMSPCIEMAAGTYTIIYDYKANSSLTEAFEVFYGNGAHVADMTNAVATHSFNNTDYETATTTITIAADGIYNFGFHATSLAGNLGFSIDNFKVYPVNDVVVTYAENGTVTPNGTIAVNYGEDLTLNLVPDPMYHVAGVWVDNVQVVPEDGTGANFMLYTLENVTEPHTIFVDFKLEFHIFKSVENYRSDLYSDLGGAFVPAATDTTINPDPFTVTMVADPHYHLMDLTLSPMDPNMQMDVFADVVNNGDGTYNYTIDTLVVANYYLNATFRRDTVAINYNVLTGKGYANDSELMNVGDTYTTWVDYSVNNDVDTTITFYADENNGYHIVDVAVNGVSQGRVDSYTFVNVTETQNVDLKFGYRIDAFVSNYNTYDSITDIMGTITPDTQYVAEYDPMLVIGTVEEHFHLYQFLVNGVNRIDEVVFGSDPHYYYFTMDSIAENYTIEAVVKVDTFAITYNVLAGQGYADVSGLLVEGDSYSTIVNYADNWYSDITPATGYSIGNVTLDGQNLYTANNYQFNYIEESHNFYITFEPNTYTVTVNAYGEGTVSDGMTFTYDPENIVNYNLNALAAEGYHIASVVINNQEMTITDPQTYAQTIENVADNYVINVHFAINTYTMTAEASNGGTITPNGTQVVNYGSNVNYEIVANQGWYIAQTVIDGVTTDYTQADDVVSLTVPFTAIDANHSVSVLFDQFMYNITGTVGANGTVNGETTINASMPYGSNYSLTITPADNYQVADVVIDGVSMGAITSYEFINITANHNVVVTFEPIMYTLTATSNIEACTITPATTTVQAGDSVVYTLTIANGYDLDGVIANGQEVDVNINTNTNTNSFTIRNIQSDYTIFANFIPEYVTVTVSDEIVHATVTPGGEQIYAYGATPTYMIVPEMGYEVTEVRAGDAIVNVTYNNGIGTFILDTLKQDVTLTATVVKKQYTITVIAPEHGTITPGDTTVEYGAMVVYTITPDEYYTISDVKVDGSSRGQLSSYTFYNVTSNHTITAEFVPMPCDLMAENLTASNITLTTAHLTWSGDAQWYDVQYKTVDATSYSVAASKTSDDTLTLTDLQYNTLYIWRVRAYCDSANDIASDWVVGTFTTLDCNMPANLNAVVDSITAILTWEGSAESYVLRYRVVGEANYTIIDNIDENTYTLDDLTLNVQYEWGVKSICAEDIESEWAESTFSTVQTGIANADMSSIKVYSFQNNVYIVNEEGIAISNVDIYDIYGKQVYTGKVLSSPEVISLNVANGNYVVRLATENGVGVYKVAIVR